MQLPQDCQESKPREVSRWPSRCDLNLPIPQFPHLENGSIINIDLRGRLEDNAYNASRIVPGTREFSQLIVVAVIYHNYSCHLLEEVSRACFLRLGKSAKDELEDCGCMIGFPSVQTDSSSDL